MKYSTVKMNIPDVSGTTEKKFKCNVEYIKLVSKGYT